MEKPNPEIISMKAQMRDIEEDVRRLKISMVSIQETLLKYKKK